MIIRCKITDKNDRTYGDCQWGKGIEHSALGKGNLSTAYWIHVYTNPYLGVLLNATMRNYDLATAHLWCVECWGRCRSNRGLIEGWQHVRSRERMKMPQVSLTQKIVFGILCGLQIYNTDETYCQWAVNWLTGKDRTISLREIIGATRSRTWVPAEAIVISAIEETPTEAEQGAAATAMMAANTKSLDLIRLAQIAMMYDDAEISQYHWLHMTIPHIVSKVEIGQTSLPTSTRAYWSELVRVPGHGA